MDTGMDGRGRGLVTVSFVLVAIAGVTLVAGLFSDELTLIWASLGACVVAMVTLVIAVRRVQRSVRGDGPDHGQVSGGDTGPGSIGP